MSLALVSVKGMVAFTRIVKIGARRGDGAGIAMLELIATEFEKKEKKRLKEKLKEVKAKK